MGRSSRLNKPCGLPRQAVFAILTAMSYSIDVFVEKKPKGAAEWHLVGNSALMEYCQHLIINDDDFDRCDIDGDDFYVMNEPVSDGLQKCFENGIDGYIVRECPLDKYKARCKKHVDDFEDSLRVGFKALGISCDMNDYGDVLDLHRESNKKYTAAGNIRKGYNQLTFPVDKNLLFELNFKTDRYKKALMWIGLMSHIVEEPDAEYRLVFVRIY
jgi:hypothetical protein